MAYKRYTRSLLLWFILLLTLTFALSYTLVIQQWYLNSVLLALLIAITGWRLFRVIDSTNRRLGVHFKQMRANDYSIRLPEKNQGLGFEQLNSELNLLSVKIQRIEHLSKKHEGIFSAIVDHLNVGVFLLDKNRYLYQANPPARKFLNVRSANDYQKLQERAPYFFSRLKELEETPKLSLEINNGGEMQQWQVQRKRIHQQDEHFELFLVHNVQSELESKESEVAEQLMHTLTHEIMNSISPITSLTDTLQLLITNLNPTDTNQDVDAETYEDLQTTARIIKKRGMGLIEFVQRYSMLARLPQLQIDSIESDELLKELDVLFKSDLEKQGIKLQVFNESQHIRFRGDKQLLLQVLINLVKNASEALEGVENAAVSIRMSRGDGYSYFSVRDNAGGIPPHLRKDIFLPFFSTKAKGSGIGLSLSRKIIEVHHGRLYLKSHDEGSEFMVELAD